LQFAPTFGAFPAGSKVVGTFIYGYLHRFSHLSEQPEDMKQRLAIWVVSKCAQAHFKDGARGVSGQACLSKSTLVLSLEGTSAGCFEATQIYKTFSIPLPAASYGKPMQATINQTKVPTDLASHRERQPSRENARKSPTRR